jgi:hypothetical protein
MKIICQTTATNSDWVFQDIEVDESYYPTWVASLDKSDEQQLAVLQAGIDQGFISIIGNQP